MAKTVKTAKAKKTEKAKKANHSEVKAKSKGSGGSKRSNQPAEGASVSGSVLGSAVTTSPMAAASATTAALATASAAASVPPSLLINDTILADDTEVILTDAEGRRYCRATDCDQVGMVDGYCRYHYLYFWKKIQVRKKILADGKLERYIEELTARYTDKFIELLRKDLRTEKDFLAAVQELELDDSSSSSSPQDEDEAKNYIEEISGVASDSSGREDDGY